ncbi:Pentatricopeptide repeat [Quillaja saponaria]|uniref:Pentatricopeptide repeat n=1 Tax=Quillaja saponaria TaxID=32244 RepID=A0AAD7LZC0_QUISA|nr:Pentatricopeptide repeat [Quillaja saponaria]
MERHGILPDVVTYSILVKGLSDADMSSVGVVANSVTYNALINEYCKQGNMEKALEVCSQMTDRKIEPNLITFSTLVDGFCKAGNLKVAMGLFTEMILKDFGPDVVAYTALIDGHCKDGNNQEALRLHDEMPEIGLTPNVLTVSCLIDGLLKDGRISAALKLFYSKTGAGYSGVKADELDHTNCTPNIVIQMQMDNVEPDQVTVTVALSACADIGALEKGEWIHAYVRRKQGLNMDLCLKNALINMYAKCGDIITAKRLFDSIRTKDVTTWTSMIAGHALHGQAEEALKLFYEMKDLKQNPGVNKGNNISSSSPVLPNDVTFVGVQMACSHAGAGCPKDAYDFILDMPMLPNAIMWRTLLGVCSLHSNVELAAKVRSKLLELDPNHVGDSVAMSNVYAAKGMWCMKTIVRNQIKLLRVPGCSSIEVGSEVSEFVRADDNHPFKTEIY